MTFMVASSLASHQLMGVSTTVCRRCFSYCEAVTTSNVPCWAEKYGASEPSVRAVNR